MIELLVVISIIAILAGILLITVGSSSDSSEAARIINDLKNLRAASILFHFDNARWPRDNDGKSLEKYLDRDIFTIGTYGNDPLRLSGIVDLSYKELIGFSVADFSSGIREKLIKNTETGGMYRTTGTTPEAYYDGGDDIYIIIK